MLLGDDGALAGCKAGSVLVDMTTSEPSLAVEIAEQAQSDGVASIDAPVSGGDVGARNATLSIMIGGDAATVAALEPIWKTMGQKWIHQGGPGAGQHTKMVNQILIATGMIGVCEALLVRLQGGTGSGKGAGVGRFRRGRELVALELRAADHRRQFRSGLLCRSLHQGYGHCAGRSAADESVAAGTGAGRAALPGRRRSRARTDGHAFADIGPGATVQR